MDEFIIFLCFIVVVAWAAFCTISAREYWLQPDLIELSVKHGWATYHPTEAGEVVWSNDVAKCLAGNECEDENTNP